MIKVAFFYLLVTFGLSLFAGPQESYRHHVPYNLLPFYDNYIEKGLIEFERGNFRNALRIFNKAKEIIPNLPDSYLNLAAIYLKHGDLTRADKNLEKAEQFLYPQYSRKNIFFYNKGLSAHMKGRSEQAYQLYQKSLDLGPETAEAIYGQALIDKEKGRYQGAFKKLILARGAFGEQANSFMVNKLNKRVAEINSLAPSLDIDLVEEAKQELDKGRTDSAALFLKEFLKKNPQDSQAYYRLGIVQAQGKNYQKAARAFKKAVNYRKDFIQAYINLGSAYGSMEEYEMALKSFQKALSLEEDNPNIHYNLAMIYYVTGRPGLSGQHLGKAKELALEKGQESLLARIEELSKK